MTAIAATSTPDGVRAHLDRLQSVIESFAFTTVGELSRFMHAGSKESAPYFQSWLADEVALEVILAACGVSPTVVGAHALVVQRHPVRDLVNRLARLGIYRPSLPVGEAARWALVAAMHAPPQMTVDEFVREWEGHGPDAWLYAAAGFEVDEIGSATPEQARLIAAMMGVPVGDA